MRAKEFVEEWLGMVLPTEHENFQARVLTPPPVIIHSHDGKPLGQGKYGRWLVQVLRPHTGVPDAEDFLGESLVLHGHAERVIY